MDKIHSEHQFALMLPQDETEQIFLDNLKDVHGITVERGYEVTSLDEFTRTSAEGKEETLVRVSAKNLTTNNDGVILARYVVGCDGARSLVRKTMKANFVGMCLSHNFDVN
jgi:2-polyprenyl-6-methoxyphenol hydroxylase-like FAD-dependent oxidoreductase